MIVNNILLGNYILSKITDVWIFWPNNDIDFNKRVTALLQTYDTVELKLMLRRRAITCQK